MDITDKKQYYAQRHFDEMYRKKNKLTMYNALDLCMVAQSSFSEGFDLGVKLKKKESKTKPKWLSVIKDKNILLEIGNNQLLLLNGRNGVKYCGYYYRTTGFKDTSLKPLSGINKFMLFPKEYA